MLRTSCSAACRGFDKIAKKRRDPCLESTTLAFIMKRVPPPHATPTTSHPGSRYGKETHRHGHQRPSRHHGARASESGADHKARRLGRAGPPDRGTRRLSHPDWKSHAYVRPGRPPIGFRAGIRRGAHRARRPSCAPVGREADHGRGFPRPAREWNQHPEARARRRPALRRHPAAKLFGFIVTLFRRLAVILLFAMGALAYIGVNLNANYAGFNQEVFVDLPKGTGTRQIAALLQNAGVIRYSWTFLMARAFRRGATLQAGEYRFTHPASVVEVFDRIQRGDVFY